MDIGDRKERDGESSLRAAGRRERVVLIGQRGW